MLCLGVLKEADVSAANLGAGVAALDAQLVDLTLGDIGSFFSFIQLVLELTELAEMNIGLLLLSR